MSDKLQFVAGVSVRTRRFDCFESPPEPKRRVRTDRAALQKNAAPLYSSTDTTLVRHPGSGQSQPTEANGDQPQHQGHGSTDYSVAGAGTTCRGGQIEAAVHHRD